MKILYVMAYFKDMFSISVMYVTKLITCILLLYLCQKQVLNGTWSKYVYLYMWYLFKYFIKLGLVMIRPLIIRIVGTNSNQNLCSNFRFQQLSVILLLTMTPESSNGFCNTVTQNTVLGWYCASVTKYNWIKSFIPQVDNKQTLSFRCIWKG